MATSSYDREILGDTIFSTYGAEGITDRYLMKSESRSRNWERLFKSRRDAMKQLAANGFLPTTTYVDNLSQAINSRVLLCEGRLYADPRSTFVHSFIPSTPRYPVNPLTDSTVASLVAGVQSGLAQRVSGHGASVPMTLLQAESTIGMIADAAKRLHDAYRKVRRGRFREAALLLGLPASPHGVRRSRKVSDNWLEYRYGWRLVCYDVQSYLRTLFDIMHRPIYHRVEVTCRNMRDLTWDSKGLSIFLPNGRRSFYYDQEKETNLLAEVRGGYVYELSCPGLATAEAFGLLNPFYVAWDLVPFSFVFDWFVNVGDCLAGLTAFAGKRCVDGWLCRMIQSRTTYRWYNQRVGEVAAITRMPHFVSEPVVERRFHRSPMEFTPPLPRFSFDLNVPRLLDAVSLLSGIGKSPSRAIANVI